jgi:signal transduction histidine kinase
MKTILLIDDDEGMRFTFGLVLRKNGYHVIEANSGSSGLEMARQYLPDLILTDIHMPGGDGSTLLKDIRRDPELRSKQVVFMTGRPDLVTPRKGMEEGADDFLMKPVSMEALLACMTARFNRASISWRVEDQMLAQLQSSVPSNLPHEFFTPMAGIIGLLEILRETPELSPTEINEIHNDIYQSALRLNRTLRNYLLILELQTPSAESITSHPLTAEEAEAAIWAGVNEVLRSNDRRKDITVQTANHAILVKPADLSRIIEELADNACKFSRRDTPVKIELGSEGTLTVTDEGRGMDLAEINRIGAFQQFDRKKHEQQGLGLGLILVQKLSARCGATFSINSQLGQGTQVQIAFPRQSPEQAKTA